MADGGVEEEANQSTLALDCNKQKEFEDKVKGLSAQADDLTPGVIYVGHIPHGFYENQMRGFFSQFGTVNKVKLSRSRKTTRSKGYAFVEFACEEVAKIVVDTMHNYMMFGKLLKCKIIPNEKVHPRLWKGSCRKFRYIDWKNIEKKKQNKEKTDKEHDKQVRNILRKENKKRKKMKKLGIDYGFPGYSSEVKAKRPKHMRFDIEENKDERTEKEQKNKESRAKTQPKNKDNRTKRQPKNIDNTTEIEQKNKDNRIKRQPKNKDNKTEIQQKSKENKKRRKEQRQLDKKRTKEQR